MYQYRNLPPRHQIPGLYPPHQPSLRSNLSPPAADSPDFMDQIHPKYGSDNGGNGLKRSHSHHDIYSQPPSSNGGYRTHHIVANGAVSNGMDSAQVADANVNGYAANANNADALYAIQQMQRIKAATACQIINNRVVEAIRQQQEQKQHEKEMKKKLFPNWRDPNETNPNNPAYIGPENAKLAKMIARKNRIIKRKEKKENVYIDKDTESENERKVKEILLSLDAAEEALNANAELTENEKLMAIPQLEISTEPHSTANITNLTDEELKMNPELYKMYNYYIPFAGQGAVNNISPNIHSLQSCDSSPKRMKRNKYSNKNPFGSPSHSMNGSIKMTNLSDTKSPSSVHSKSKSKRNEPYVAPSHTNVQSVISPNGGIYHPCHGYSTREISIFDLFPGIVKYQSKKFAEHDRVSYLVTLSDKGFGSVAKRPLNVDEAEMWYIALKYLFNDITLGQFDYMTVEMRYVIKQYMSTHANRLTFLNSIKSYGFLRVISDISKKLPREHIQKIMRQEAEKKEQQKRAMIQEQERVQKLFQQQLLIQQQQQQQLYFNNNNPAYVQSNGLHHYNDWYNGDNRLRRTISEPIPLQYGQYQHQYKPIIIDDNGQNESDIDDSWNFVNEIVNENGLEVNIPDLPPDDALTSPSKCDDESSIVPVAMNKIVADAISQCDDIKSKEEESKKIITSNNKNNIIDADDDDKKDYVPSIKSTEKVIKKEKAQSMDVYSLLFDAMKDKNNKNDDHNNNNNNNNDDDDQKEDEDIDQSPKIPMESLLQIERENKLKSSDDSFIAKLPFKWSKNSQSSSIWTDNPYAKPSKHFESKSKKSSSSSKKYKRAKK